MTDKSENFETPKNNKPRLRRLGLRRITKKTPLHRGANVLFKQDENLEFDVRAIKSTSVITPASVTQSDLRVNYRCLESEQRQQQKESFKCATPLTSSTNSSALSTTAKSTNCRQFRYGLSRQRVREKFTKKRLQFHAEHEETPQKQTVKMLNENETPTTTIAAAVTTVPTEVTELTRDELIAAIKEAQAELAAQQRHEEKVRELKESIETWRIGFTRTLGDLQRSINPQPTRSELLTQLQIPQRMLKYVEDASEGN